MRALVQYIKPNTWPSKLQLSLLGYFPGLYETATGETDAPSRHSCTAHPLLLLLSLSPHPASAPVVFIDSQLHHDDPGHVVSNCPFSEDPSQGVIFNEGDPKGL